MVPVQDIIVVPNLVHFHRRQGSPLPHCPFDIPEPLTGNMFFRPEPGIKIIIFTHTANNIFQGNGLNPVVNKLHILFLVLLFVKGMDMVIVFIWCLG